MARWSFCRWWTFSSTKWTIWSARNFCQKEQQGLCAWMWLTKVVKHSLQLKQWNTLVWMQPSEMVGSLFCSCKMPWISGVNKTYESRGVSNSLRKFRNCFLLSYIIYHQGVGQKTCPSTRAGQRISKCDPKWEMSSSLMWGFPLKFSCIRPQSYSVSRTASLLAHSFWTCMTLAKPLVALFCALRHFRGAVTAGCFSLRFLGFVSLINW